MHSTIPKKINRLLLPAVLILFILQVITLPLMLGITYSGRSESPNNVLTYTKGKLTWDTAANIDQNGAVMFDLFETDYDGVESENDEDVVAPGTDDVNIVRLVNGTADSIKYTAVLYKINTSDDLPVIASLGGNGFSETNSYPLPKNVSADQVVRAVNGTLSGSGIQDFDVTWLWEFYESDEQDLADTAFGNKTELDRVTIGIYIVVEDDSYIIEDEEDDDNKDNDTDSDKNIITPNVPKTGDDSHIYLCLILMAVSFVVLVLLFIENRIERYREKARINEDNQ